MCIRDRANTLCPGLEEVIVYGGCIDDLIGGKLLKDRARMSETTIFTFSELAPLYLALYM